MEDGLPLLGLVLPKVRFRCVTLGVFPRLCEVFQSWIRCETNRGICFLKCGL